MSLLMKVYREHQSEVPYVPQFGCESADALGLEALECLREHDGQVETALQLEEIAMGLESTLDYLSEQNSLSVSGAALLADPYYSRLGIDDELAASLESSQDEEEVLRVTTEGIAETIKKTTKAIIDAVLKAIKFIKDFFAKVFGGYQKLEKQATKLKRDLGKIDFNKSVESVNVPAPATLTYNGFVSASGIMEGLKNLTVVSKDINGPYIESLKKYYAVAEKSFLLAKPAFVDFSLNGKTLKDHHKEDLEVALKEMHTEELVSANSRIFSTLLIGDKQFFPDEKKHLKHVKNNDEKKLGLKIATFSVPTPPRLITPETIKVQELEGTMEPMSKDQLGKVLDHVIAVSKIAETGLKKVDQVNKERSKLLDEIKDTAQTLASKESGFIGSYAFSQATKDLWGKYLKAIQKDMLRPVTVLSVHGFKCCRSALSLVNSHYKTYSNGKYKIDVSDSGKLALPSPA